MRLRFDFAPFCWIGKLNKLSIAFVKCIVMQTQHGAQREHGVFDCSAWPETVCFGVDARRKEMLIIFRAQREGRVLKRGTWKDGPGGQGPWREEND